MNHTNRARILAASALACVGLLFAQSASAQSKCDNPVLRDSTCVGSIDSPGAHPNDFSDLNAALPGAAVRPRGSNAITTPHTTVPTQQTRNECVSIPFVSWAYDPASYGIPLPSFVTPAGSGYLGAGESTGPTQPYTTCVSDSDGSCATWVPQSHPFLFVDGTAGTSSHFQQCTGSPTSGSVSCPVAGSASYVTSNPAAGWNFTAWMVACKTADMTPGLKIAGADMTWYSNCSASSLCGFFVIFPQTTDN